jgi:hypothetical protein
MTSVFTSFNGPVLGVVFDLAFAFGVRALVVKPRTVGP